MKFKIALIIGLILVAFLFWLFTDSSTYYTNSGEKTMTAQSFDLECKLIPSKDKGINFLEVNFLYHPNEAEQLKQLAIATILNGKDTLKLNATYGILYHNFEYPNPNRKDKLSLLINYKIDSAGITINKSRKYYNLQKIHTYRFQAPFIKASL